MNMEMNVKKLTLAMVVGMLIPIAGVLAEQPLAAKALFEKMMMASKALNYEGIFVYNRNGRMDTLKIVHLNDQEGEHEELTALNGVNWRVIRKNDQVFCVFPGNNAGVLQHHKIRNLLGLNPAVTLSLLEGHYLFAMEQVERIAGKISQAIFVKPKDQFRYGYRFWVDRENSLLLRTDVVGEGNKAVEQMMFTMVKVYQEVLPTLEKATSYLRETNQPPVQARSSMMGPERIKWRVQLPPGFFLAEQGIVGHRADKKTFEHIVYTDGLASISVFIEKYPHAKPLQNRQAIQQGAINALALMDKNNQHRITVVGEVPTATVQKIADSLNSDF